MNPRDIEQLAFHEALTKWAQENAITFPELAEDLEEQAARSKTLETLRRLGKRTWDYGVGPQMHQVTEPLLSYLNVRNPFPM